MLHVLVRFDILLPKTAVDFLLSNLIHDSKNIRETALSAVVKVLFQHCRPERKLAMMADSNYRSFDFSVDLTVDRNLYEKTIFVDCLFEGFKVEDGVPFEVHVPNTSKQCKLYLVIVKKFSDEKFLSKFF